MKRVFGLGNVASTAIKTLSDNGGGEEPATLPADTAVWFDGTTLPAQPDNIHTILADGGTGLQQFVIQADNIGEDGGSWRKTFGEFDSESDAPFAITIGNKRGLSLFTKTAASTFSEWVTVSPLPSYTVMIFGQIPSVGFRGAPQAAFNIVNSSEETLLSIGTSAINNIFVNDSASQNTASLSATGVTFDFSSSVYCMLFNIVPGELPTGRILFGEETIPLTFNGTTPLSANVCDGGEVELMGSGGSIWGTLLYEFAIMPGNVDDSVIFNYLTDKYGEGWEEPIISQPPRGGNENMGDTEVFVDPRDYDWQYNVTLSNGTAVGFVGNRGFPYNLPSFVSSGSTRPTYVSSGGPGNKGFLRFAGGQALTSQLNESWTLTFHNGFGTYYIWYRVTGTDAQHVLLSSNNVDSGIGFSTLIDDRTSTPASMRVRHNVRGNNNAIDATGANNSAGAGNAWHLMTVMLIDDGIGAPADLFVYIDGVEVASANRTSSLTTNPAVHPLTVGATGALAFPLTGDLGPIIMYDQSHDETQRDIVYAWFDQEFPT